MAIDQNVYALSLSLQLDAAAAFATLDDFGEKAESIEKNISTAAKNTINSIAGIASTLSQNISSAADTTKSFTSAGVELETTLSKAADAIRDAYDTQSDSLTDIEERLKFLEDIEDIQEKLEKSLEAEHTTGQEYLKLIEDWVKALEIKNLVHGEEGSLLTEEQGMLQAMNNEAKNLSKNFGSSRDVLHKIRAVLSTILGIISKFDKETELFAVSTFRVYGSQQQLLNQTRQLSSEYGIFRKEAIETYKALANVKTPRNEIDGLAVTVARANRTTGVGIDTIAQYSFQLRGAGFDADRTRKQIDLLSAAQRKFGLTTADVQKAIESQTLSISDQITFFGKDAPETFAKVAFGLKGVEKEIGEIGNATEDWMKVFQLTGVEAIVFWGKLGVAANDTEAQYAAMGQIAAQVAQRVGVSMEQLAAGDLTERQRAELKIYREVLDLTTDQIRFAALATLELTEAQKAELLTLDGLTAAFKTQMDANKRWQESMNTLTAQWNSLKGSVSAVIGVIVQLAADALIPLIDGLIWVISKIGAFISIVKSAIGWMEEWIPGFKQFMTVMKFVVGILIAVSIAILVAGLAFATFATAFAGSVGLIRGSVAIIQILGQVIISIATAIGGAIRIILTSIGQGLAALGSAIAPIILPLMGLGLVVLMVGASFYLMGLGLMYAAQSGWKAVAMLSVMGVVMLAMVLALIAMAVYTAPAIPLLLALGAALALVGLAAMLMGLGLYLASLGVKGLSEYGLAAAEVLPALGTAMFWFGIKAAAAAPGLIALGAAMAIAAIPALILASAFYIMSAAMTILVALAPHLVEFGVALRDMILTLSESASLLIPIGLKLVAGAFLIAIGSTLLLIAAPTLTAAAILMLVGGAILVVAGAVLGVGAGVLLGAAVMMFTAGVLIGIGGTLMLVGMTSMMAATVLMFGSAITLFFASTALAIAVGYLVPIAATMMTTGILMLAGGVALYASMVVLYGAALWMQVVGELLMSASVTLRLSIINISESSGMLISAAKKLGEAAYMLFIAGRWLIPAALSIYVGMIWLEGAISRFVRTVGKVDKMGKAMYLLAISFGILHQAPIGALGAAADEALLAIPTINKVARELDRSATAFQRAADKFVKPVSTITEALTELNTAMLSLESAVGIEATVVAKAIPAIGSATEAGLEEAVRSEAITTVQVMDKTEGGAAKSDKNAAALEAQTTLLQEISDKLDGMQKAEELAVIADLLGTYLPAMKGTEEGLTSEFNQWTK